MSKQIQKKNDDTQLAEGGPSASFLAKRKAAMQAQGQDLVRIGTLHLHQGSGKEDMKYGSHPKGSWIDELSGSAIEDGARVLPVHAEAYKAVWYRYESKKGEGWPLATFKGGEDRPTHDTDGSPIPWEDPDIEIRDHIDLFLLVGDGIAPRLYRAKSTALNPVKSLNMLEMERVSAGRMPGAYRLGKTQKSNDENQWYVPQFVADGDATTEELGRLEAAFDLVTSGNYEVAETPEPTAAADAPADDIPI